VEVTQEGRKLADLGPGSWFGEIALLTQEPRSATVTATTPLRALVIVDRAFRGLVERHPSIASKIFSCVALRLARNAQS
jgi:CRP-like cAMP-binding protein